MRGEARNGRRQPTILVADDDPEDRLLIQEAFEECGIPTTLRFVADGEQLMDYLHRRGAYRERDSAPRPGLILLDLNMPRKDGREVLREVKSDVALWQIPVVVFTTSDAEDDVSRSYALGASAFITKPVTFDGLVDTVQAMGRYWLEVVSLPFEEQ